MYNECLYLFVVLNSVNKEVPVDSKEAKTFLQSQTVRQPEAEEPAIGDGTRDVAAVGGDTCLPPSCSPSTGVAPPKDSDASKPSMAAGSTVAG